jgi:glycerate 2-kinase
VRKARPDARCDLCPMADGGEGTVEALVTAAAGELRRTKVVGPLGERIEAAWGLIEGGRTAVIEMAAAAGLDRVPADRRDPTRTTTYGVGELIKAALDARTERIIIGIGGSATNDGGAGLAQALGVEFVGVSGDYLCGGVLAEIEDIDWTGLDARLARTEVIVATDVDNPLTGEEGAAAVYGPQKGADAAQVRTLDLGLGHLASVVAHSRLNASNELPRLRLDGEPPADPRILRERLDRLPGAGAAGGLGFGLAAFCGARLVSGAGLVLDVLRFDERVRDADFVLTGEGQLDGQSLRGKTVIAVARAAKRHGVPVFAVAGALGPQLERTLEHGLTAWFSHCNRPMSLDEALHETDPLLTACAANITRSFLAACRRR